MVDFVDLMDSRSFVESEEPWYSDVWAMQPSHSGIRLQCLKDDKGVYSFLGKRKSYKVRNNIFPGLVKSLIQCNMLENTLIEGNLVFKDNSKVFKFLKIEQLDQEFYDDACFIVTDIIYLNDKPVFDLPLFDRLAKLSNVIKESPLLRLQQSFSKSKKQIFEKLKEDYDVFNFRHLESTYKFGVRSSKWLALKNPQQFFMIVLGFVESEDSKYKGLVMAIEGGQIRDGQIVKIMNVPVHNNDTRFLLYKSKDVFLWKVFEILAEDRTKDDKFLEARFVKIREDKTIEDCV